MATVLIFGLGELGGWALELLARSEGIDRIVIVRRSEPSLPTPAGMATVGAVFQDHVVSCETLVGDITDVDATADLLRSVDPDVILNTATVQSPRMMAAVDVDADVRELLRRAKFGMWLPWHLLPATRLTEAALAADVTAPVVNIAFPDVVNPAIWRRFEYGPIAGGGNGEVSAAVVSHYVATHWQVSLDEVDVALVASHAFLTHGTEVPHLVRVWVDGEDVTDSLDIATILSTHPEPIDWTRTPNSSVFAASAVKNVVALLSPRARYMHVAAPNGLPGSYPALVSDEGIELDLPDGVTVEEAVEINMQGNRHDGIQRIAEDGTVEFTDETAAAMEELGYDGARVRFDELDERVEQLTHLFQRITS